MNYTHLSSLLCLIVFSLSSMELPRLPEATPKDCQELVSQVCNDRIKEVAHLLTSRKFDQPRLQYALWLAMSNGHCATFILLLENGANPNIASTLGTKQPLPLCQAVDVSPKFIMPLRAFGANPFQVCDSERKTPLQMAREKLEKLRNNTVEFFGNESAAYLQSRRNVRPKQIEDCEQLIRYLEMPSSVACGNITAQLLSRETGVKRRASEFRAKYIQAAKRPVTLESALRHQDMQQFDTLLEKFRPEALTDRDRAEVDRAVRHCFTMGYTSQLDKLKERGADIEQSFKYFATSLHTPNHAKVAEHCLNNKWIILATIKKMYNEIKDAKKSSHYYELSDEEWAQRKQTIENILEKALKEAGAL